MTQGSKRYSNSEKRGKESFSRHASSASDASSSSKAKEKSSSSKPPSMPTKIVVRRLPPSWTSEVFLEQVSPLPAHNYYHFVSADRTLGMNAFSRAYINFSDMADLRLFHEKFDGYVFVDERGSEYTAGVEFAPFTKIPKNRNKNPDARENTIESDAEYLKFIENKDKDSASVKSAFSPELLLEEIETKEKNLKLHGQFGPKVVTPLIEFLIRRKEEKKNAVIQAREDRRQADLARRKQREEERVRKINKEKERKERDKQRQKEREEAERKQKEAESVPKFKVLKNEDRQKKDSDEGRTVNSKSVITDDPAVLDVGRVERKSSSIKDSSDTASGSSRYRDDKTSSARDRDSKSSESFKKDDSEKFEKGKSTKSSRDDYRSSGNTSRRDRDRERDRDRDRDREREIGIVIEIKKEIEIEIETGTGIETVIEIKIETKTETETGIIRVINTATLNMATQSTVILSTVSQSTVILSTIRTSHAVRNTMKSQRKVAASVTTSKTTSETINGTASETSRKRKVR